MSSGGCSPWPWVGITQDTAGRFPSAAASKNSVLGRTLSSCPVTSTDRKPGRGFCTATVFEIEPSTSGHGGALHVPGPTKYPQLTPALYISQVMSPQT